MDYTTEEKNVLKRLVEARLLDLQQRGAPFPKRQDGTEGYYGVPFDQIIEMREEYLLLSSLQQRM